MFWFCTGAHDSGPEDTCLTEWYYCLFGLWTEYAGRWKACEGFRIFPDDIDYWQGKFARIWEVSVSKRHVLVVLKRSTLDTMYRSLRHSVKPLEWGWRKLLGKLEAWQLLHQKDCSYREVLAKKTTCCRSWVTGWPDKYPGWVLSVWNLTHLVNVVLQPGKTLSRTCLL